jgi:hypothetical protein
MAGTRPAMGSLDHHLAMVATAEVHLIPVAWLSHSRTTVRAV